MLGQIIGNEPFKQSLQAALRAGRLSHSVLLCGEEGCGTGFAARCLAADYLYPQGGAAARAVLQSAAPECIQVRGEGALGEIRIDQVRTVRRQVFETALSAAGRVVIFYGAHKLNQASANALLKVLEEPPPGVLFILTAYSAAAVLPTIRSRCGQFQLAPVSPEQCEAYLQAHCPGCGAPGLLARVYAGRIGLALAAATDEAARRSLETALQLARAVGGQDRCRALCLLAAYEKDKPAALRLLSDLANVAAAALEGGDLGLSPRQAARCAAACGAAQQAVRRNLNQKLLFTRLAARLCAGA